MRRWQRRIGVVASLTLALLIARAGCSLRPPTLPVPLEWYRLSGVTVINPGRDRRVNQTVTLRDGLIESIRDRSRDEPRARRSFVFEQRYVLPGLIDTAVRLPALGHLQRLFGVFFLAAGVTTVRDVGNLDGSIAPLQQQIAAGEIPWPRLIACGRVLEGDPPRCPDSRVVRDPGEARAAVDDLVAMGAGCVAVDATLTAESFAAVHQAAVAKGLAVVGHIPPGAPRDAATFAAVQIIGAPPRQPDPSAGWQGLDPAAVDALAASAAQASAYAPSVLRWSQLLRQSDPTLQRELRVELLPRFYREVIWEREMSAAANSTALLAPTLTDMRETARRLHDAGGRIIVGSGTPSAYVVPGVGEWFEMLHLVEAGLTPEDAWVAATRAAGEALGIAKLGTIEEGAPADLLILRQDPTQDLMALTSLEAVVSRGRLYPVSYLNGFVLQYARYVQGATYDQLSMLAARIMAWWRGDALMECDSL
jgi:hypothetical protein